MKNKNKGPIPRQKWGNRVRHKERQEIFSNRPSEAADVTLGVEDGLTHIEVWYEGKLLHKWSTKG